MTVTGNDMNVERLERFAAVGVCPRCRHPLDGATLHDGTLVCPQCSQAIGAQRGVVVALSAEQSASLQGWAAGIAADMNSKATTYVAKYERRTRASTGFLIRRELALTLAGSSPGRVLEAGCGPGVVSPVLSPRGVDTYGLDLSEGQLETAAANDARTLYVHGDLSSLPFRDGVFDTVVMIGVLEYLEDAPRAARELARVLSDQGRLVVSVPNAGSPVRVWTQHAYLPVTQGAKRLLGRSVAGYSRRLYSAASLQRLLSGAGLRAERTEFFDVVLAGPPLDRLLADRRQRFAHLAETRLRGPLRSLVSTQIIVSAVKTTGAAGAPVARPEATVAVPGASKPTP